MKWGAVGTADPEVGSRVLEQGAGAQVQTGQGHAEEPLMVTRGASVSWSS